MGQFSGERGYVSALSTGDPVHNVIAEPETGDAEHSRFWCGCKKAGANSFLLRTVDLWLASAL
jgi:hypothetical protein